MSPMYRLSRKEVYFRLVYDLKTVHLINYVRVRACSYKKLRVSFETNYSADHP